jgi:hypothetical protein
MPRRSCYGARARGVWWPSFSRLFSLAQPPPGACKLLDGSPCLDGRAVRAHVARAMESGDQGGDRGRQHLPGNLITSKLGMAPRPGNYRWRLLVVVRAVDRGGGPWRAASHVGSTITAREKGVRTGLDFRETAGWTGASAARGLSSSNKAHEF